MTSHALQYTDDRLVAIYDALKDGDHDGSSTSSSPEIIAIAR